MSRLNNILLQRNAKNGEENENEEILILNSLETSDVDTSTLMWRSRNSSTEGILGLCLYVDVETMEEKIIVMDIITVIIWYLSP